MYRFVTHSICGIIALICLCLGGCGFSDPVSSQTPLALPPELSVEEHALKGMPEVEPLTFVPVESTQAKILSKHQDERDKRFPDWSYSDERLVSRGDDQLTASSFVQVFRNGEVIYTIQVGTASTEAIPNLWGLWAYDNHWVLEVAHVTDNIIFSYAIGSNVFGEIIQDGISLNKQHGYQETFGFQLMKGKPFYFFKKQGWFGVSYDNREIPLGYAQILHYGCCSAGEHNPRSAENMVAFFARRGTVRPVWHYVEIGVFE